MKTRKPTGIVPYPVVLLEGEEKAGKSYAAALLSSSEKVGQTYWIDLGEGAADEYGAIDGARYLVVEHDGTFNAILAAVEEIRAEAKRAADAGEPPVVLVVDSMTAEWDLLKDWAGARAKGSKSNQAKLAKDPNAEVSVPMNLWNDATSRHRRLMTMLLTFPGIVVLIARGKEVATLDANGRPVEGSKEYKVEGHKNLAFDCSAWVRLSRDHAPQVIGLRSVHAGMRPGVDKPKPAPQFTLEWLVFDVLKCNPAKAHVRDMPTDELAKAQALVWDLAKALKWDGKALASDYAKHHDGAVIGEATADQLGEYAAGLQQEVEKREQPNEGVAA